MNEADLYWHRIKQKLSLKTCKYKIVLAFELADVNPPWLTKILFDTKENWTVELHFKVLMKGITAEEVLIFQSLWLIYGLYCQNCFGKFWVGLGWVGLGLSCLMTPGHSKDIWKILDKRSLRFSILESCYKCCNVLSRMRAHYIFYYHVQALQQHSDTTASFTTH